MTPKKQLTFLISWMILLLILMAATVFFFDPFNFFGEKDDLEDDNSARVPILMYHHFGLEEDAYPGTMISGEMFERQIKALCDAGFTAVSFEELVDFVSGGAPLPENPLIITMDDGYSSVYDVAFPILKKYNMPATSFIIGVSHGKNYYKDTNHEILPHFNDAQAQEMERSGLISIQSHSYDMHQFELYEDGPFREGVLQMEGESDDEYIKAFIFDFERAAAQIKAMVGTRQFVFSYPYGLLNEQSDQLLGDMGVKATLTVDEGINIVVRGSPETLFDMKRLNVTGDMIPADLLRMIKKGER